QGARDVPRDRSRSIRRLRGRAPGMGPQIATVGRHARNAKTPASLPAFVVENDDRSELNAEIDLRLHGAVGRADDAFVLGDLTDAVEVDRVLRVAEVAAQEQLLRQRDDEVTVESPAARAARAIPVDARDVADVEYVEVLRAEADRRAARDVEVERRTTAEVAVLGVGHLERLGRVGDDVAVAAVVEVAIDRDQIAERLAPVDAGVE